MVEVDEIAVADLGKQDFLANKRAVGSPKDLADIAWLEGEKEPGETCRLVATRGAE